MHNIFNIIIILIVALLFTGCQDNDGLQDKDMLTPIVIEGIIEEGELPVVTVTRALDLLKDKVNTDNFVEKWCRVTIEDETEGNSYILTGRMDTTRMINFIYRHEKLRGEPGHVYNLTVETETESYSSRTAIQDGASLSRLKSECVDGDSLFAITAYLSGIKPDRYYKIFSKTDKDNHFSGTFKGTFRGDEYDADQGYPIRRGIRSAYYDKNQPEQFTHYFRKGERVTVKLCAIDKEMYDFWQQYDNAVSFSSNLFFTFQENIPGNIPGALGYWAGYSSSVNHILVK